MTNSPLWVFIGSAVSGLPDGIRPLWQHCLCVLQGILNGEMYLNSLEFLGKEYITVVNHRLSQGTL